MSDNYDNDYYDDTAEFYVDDVPVHGVVDELEIEKSTIPFNNGEMAYQPKDKLNYNGNIAYMLETTRTFKDKDENSIDKFVKNLYLYSFAHRPNNKEFLYVLYAQLNRLNPKKFPIENIKKFEEDDGRWISDEERKEFGIPKFISELPSTKVQVGFNLGNQPLVVPPIGVEVYYSLGYNNQLELCLNDDFDTKNLEKKVVPVLLVKYYYLDEKEYKLYPVYRLMFDVYCDWFHVALDRDDPDFEHNVKVFNFWGVETEDIPDEYNYLFPMRCAMYNDYMDPEDYKELMKNAAGNSSKRKHRTSSKRKKGK